MNRSKFISAARKIWIAIFSLVAVSAVGGFLSHAILGFDSGSAGVYLKYFDIWGYVSVFCIILALILRWKKAIYYWFGLGIGVILWGLISEIHTLGWISLANKPLGVWILESNLSPHQSNREGLMLKGPVKRIKAFTKEFRLVWFRFKEFPRFESIREFDEKGYQVYMRRSTFEDGQFEMSGISRHEVSYADDGLITKKMKVHNESRARGIIPSGSWSSYNYDYLRRLDLIKRYDKEGKLWQKVILEPGGLRGPIKGIAQRYPDNETTERMAWVYDKDGRPARFYWGYKDTRYSFHWKKSIEGRPMMIIVQIGRDSLNRHEQEETKFWLNEYGDPEEGTGTTIDGSPLVKGDKTTYQFEYVYDSWGNWTKRDFVTSRVTASDTEPLTIDSRSIEYREIEYFHKNPGL